MTSAYRKCVQTNGADSASVADAGRERERASEKPKALLSYTKLHVRTYVHTQCTYNKYRYIHSGETRTRDTSCRCVCVCVEAVAVAAF